jgi:hypothetical protein
MEFARRLQAALNEKGWAQPELAAGVAPLLISCRDRTCHEVLEVRRR